MEICVSRDLLKWTPMAVECYMSSFDCSHCVFPRVSTEQCKMKEVVEALLIEKGPPLGLGVNMYGSKRFSGILFDLNSYVIYNFNRGHNLEMKLIRYKDANHMFEQLGTIGTKQFYKKVRDKYAPDSPDILEDLEGKSLREVVWNFITSFAVELPKRDLSNIATNKAKVTSNKKRGRPRSTAEKEYRLLFKDEKIINNYDYYWTTKVNPDKKKAPSINGFSTKQGIDCAYIAMKYGKDTFTKSELLPEILAFIEDFNKVTGLQWTTQDPWRIFTYYQSQLRNHGVIYYD